jgi:hypothetical protein
VWRPEQPIQPQWNEGSEGDFSELDIKPDRLGREILTAVTKTKRRERLSDAKLMDTFGVPDEDQKLQEPMDATWDREGTDTPVTVLKIVGWSDGEELYKVREFPRAAVRRSQITFANETPAVRDGNENEDGNPPTAGENDGTNHEERISALESAMEELREQLRAERAHTAQLEALLTERGIAIPPREANVAAADAGAADADGGTPPQPTVPAAQQPRRGLGQRMLDPFRWGRVRAANFGNGRAPRRQIRTETRMVNGVAREVFIEGGRTDGEVVVAVLGGVALGAFMYWLGAKHGHHYHYNHGNHDEITSILNKDNSKINDLTNQVNDLKAAESAHHLQEIQKLDQLRHTVGVDHELIRRLVHDEAKEAASNGLGSFHPDSFFGQTPHQAVSNMFDVIRNNNIQVHGLTSDKINQIVSDMKQHNWHIASGVGANHQQNIVYAASDWSDGHTQNWNASGLQGLEKINGSSVENWHRFMRLAAKHGVTFSQDSIK